jgi:hypothetical protein
VGSVFDFATGEVLCGEGLVIVVVGVVVFGGRFRRTEAEGLRGDGEEETFDGFEGAVGEDVDGVDDVVEEGLGGSRVSRESLERRVCLKEVKRTTGG